MGETLAATTTDLVKRLRAREGIDTRLGMMRRAALWREATAWIEHQARIIHEMQLDKAPDGLPSREP